MEFWSVSGDGNGNYVIYPTYIIGAGALFAAVLAIIKVLVDGGAEKIYEFAYDNTWIIILIIAIISIVIAVCVGFFLGKKLIYITILFGLSLIFALSLCYSELIYWVGGFAEELEEVFVVALFMSPVFLMFMLVQMAITLILCGTVFVPLLFKKTSKKQNAILSCVLGIATNILLVYLFFSSQLPSFIISSI